jgi:hypothetical protein
MIERYSGTLFEPVFTILSKEAVVRKPEGPEYALKILAVTIFITQFYSNVIYKVSKFFWGISFLRRYLQHSSMPSIHRA